MTTTIGSQSIQTGVDQSKVESQSGIGLSPDVAKETEALMVELNQAVLTNTASEHFPQALIEALNEGQAKDGTFQRIASELALAHTIEKALMARRALLTGQKEVYIAQNKPAKEAVSQSVALLEDEINALRFEAEARQTISSLTATQYMQSHYEKRNQITVNSEESESVFLNQTFNKEAE